MRTKDIRDKVLKGGKLAIEQLLDKKRKGNSYIVISENGKVIRLSAKYLKIKVE